MSKKMSDRRFPRRTFLRGAGSVSLALPFLPSLAGRAFAQISGSGSTEAPKGGIRRVIFFSLPYGTVQEHWFPSDAALTGARSVSSRAKESNLVDVMGKNGPLTVFQNSVFSGLFDKMLFLDGIDGPSSIGHEKSYSLTGFVRDEPQALPGSSIDQIIASRARIYNSEPAFRTLNIASGPGTHAGSSISYTQNGSKVVPVPQLSDPATVWDIAFQWVSSGGAQANAEFEQQRGRRLSIIDHVNGRHKALLAHPNLSCEDRSRVEAYLQHLRDYELSIKDAKLIECSTPSRPDIASYGRKDQAWTRYAEDQVDNIIHTVRCGLTHVVTFNAEPSARGYRNLPGVLGDHHGLSHEKETAKAGEGAALELFEVDRFHMGLVARLLRGLDVEEDPGSGRTFLDNSIVFVGNDMGSVANHKGHRMPCLLAGGKGYFKQGKLIDFRSPYSQSYAGTARTARIGISYNGLLVTICQAMGLRPEDYELGQEGVGDYTPSTYYYRQFPGGKDEYVAYAYGDRRAPVPELLV